MSDVLITPLDFIEGTQSYEGFRGHRGSSEDNSNSHLKGEIPGSGQASKV